MTGGVDHDKPTQVVLVVTPRRFEAEALMQAAKTAYPQSVLLLCRDGRNACTLLETYPVFLSLIALELPDIDGLDLSASLMEKAQVDRILLILDQVTEMTCDLISQEIVSGFFDSTEEPDRRLAEAIGSVGAGFAYASYPLRKARSLACAGRTPLDRLLSAAERLVFAAIGDGSDDLAASDLLGLSIHTIHTHRRNIMRKLGLKVRAELPREAVIRGVVRFGPEGVIRPGFERLLAKFAGRPARFAAV